MISRVAAFTLFAVALAAAPHAAMSQTNSQVVSISRSAGTCPKSIAVTVVTKQYPGGFTMDYTAQTSAVANDAKVMAAMPQRIAFSAALSAAYKSCEGTGKSGDIAFTLHKGNLSYVISPGKGPNNTYPGALHVNVVKGLPHANMSITD
jgi:hypothetical protein